jgi:MFS family permease
MNELPASDWHDLSKMWQADAAAVSMEEIDEHLRRQRRQLRVVTAVELAGVSLGVIAAGWLAFLTPYRWMGLVVGLFAIASAIMVVRMRREPESAGAADALRSLKESIDREDWIAEQLRYGRALSFVALFSFVMVASSQLLRFHSIPTLGLAAVVAGAVYVVGVIAWNLVLTRRAHRRRARLEYIKERLKE